MTDPRIDVDLVKGLIADQFPQWAMLDITPVKTSGWDNRTFHLGDEMSVRLPSAARYAAQVEKEQHWLPHLAPHLPLAIPRPIAQGQPSTHYPFSWSVMQWLPGETVVTAGEVFAEDLARFLNALRQVPVADGPTAGQHNFYRGGDLRIYDQEVRHCLGQLDENRDATSILSLWDKACQSAWTAAPVWVHGDVAAGNMLTRDGQLSAIIDFGSCGVGDPACDLTIAWTFFGQSARNTFRNNIGLDTATWARAKGWGLWKALLEICAGKPAARHVLETILEDQA